MKFSTTSGLLGATAISFALAGTAQAVDISAGDYTWFGHDKTFVLGYAQFSSADSLETKGVDLPNSKNVMSVALLRGLHYREIAGQKFMFQAILPVGQFHDVEVGNTHPSTKDGIGDLTLGATWFPVASEDPTGTTIGLTMFVTAPTGVHSDDVDVNFGSNTWSITPQIGLVQGLGNGFFFDGAIDVAMTETQDGESRDNSTQVQAYLRYQPSMTTSFAFGYSGTFDGKYYDDNGYTGAKSRADQVKLFANTFVTEDTQVQLMLAKDIDVEDGFKNDGIAQIRVLKAF